MTKKNSFFSFLIEDFKNDIDKAKAIMKGNVKLAFTGEQLKEYWLQSIKDNWIWFFLILLAFLCGWFISSQFYAAKCTEMINQVINIQNVTNYGQNLDYSNITGLIV